MNLYKKSSGYCSSAAENYLIEKMNEIRLFSPATVANVSCGFDVLGFCLDGVGDEMVIRKIEKKGIYITHIEGADLPYDPESNVAGKWHWQQCRKCCRQCVRDERTFKQTV